MISKSAFFGASIGLTLSALLLTGSLRAPASSTSPVAPEVKTLNDEGLKLLAQWRYYDARRAFLKAEARAEQLGRPHPMSLVGAGACLYMSLNFRGAEKDFEQARQLARASGDLVALAAAENNLANLYLHMGEREKALQVASAAAAAPEGRVNPETHGKLLFQQAVALAETNRFKQAEPLYLAAIEELNDAGQTDATARIEGAYGEELRKAGRLYEAEDVLSRGLWLEWSHRLSPSGNILSSLAQVKSTRGDSKSAAALFQAALAAPPNTSPVWLIRSREGRFLLDGGDYSRALADFRAARGAALEMRADMVPADQDRVAFESSDLSSVIEGLVESGNLLAKATGDQAVLHETFDAAEQDRMWSLRALVPAANDWRSRLPEHYWELLAQFQGLERTAVAARSPEASARIEQLRLEMQKIEATAAGDSQSVGTKPESALLHAQNLLDADTVLFSFLLTRTSAWVWAVDRTGVDAYRLPSPDRISREADAFADAVQRGDFNSVAALDLYHDLFGELPEKYRNRKLWLIEPDGALNKAPFAALRPVPGEFLVQRAAIESIPGALLLERGSIPASSPFLGVGDPVYNSADSRYSSESRPGLALPRLPNTAAELVACSRAWGAGNPRLLTGAAATAELVEASLGDSSGIVHFATHVITEPGEFRSGMIALSLDSQGGMGLLGPKDIVARPVKSSLVVMNGCHSAQGKALPATGLMGLTRAWIGAGAKAVISTQWDVPDDAAQSLMTDFYRALHDSPVAGAAFALQDAQLKAIRRADERHSGSEWAAYSLLSRLP